MRNEVDAAANFIAANLSLGSSSSSEQAASFVALLSTTLSKRYTGHWHVGEPERGSAFRALTRSGHAVDQLILDAAARASSLDASQVCKQLSKSMQSDRWTLWIDPGCVSIRLHEGGATTFTSLDQASKSSAALAGIREIWGKLPASLVGGAGPSTSSSSVERPKTPFNRTSTAAGDEVHAAAMSEFVELIKEANASPSKRSKAIAIVRPGSVSAAIAAAADPVRQAATPPRPPLPPLHFTIQESTSPYVPSFAAPAAHIASSATPSNSTTPTPLASSPLAATAVTTSTSSHSESASDPFARPSSRSSTTSAESAVSCSIFSHSSSESRSSSIGSYSTMASSIMPSIASVIPKATPHEMNQAAMFTFPNTLSCMNAPGMKSVPASPSKSRRGGGSRHQHTLSTSSAVSVASSTTSGGAPVAHPGHQRARSSQSNIRVSANAGQVQDYSNGKVGVLGGGVLLGLGGGNKSSSSSDKTTRRPGPRPTSASSSSSSNGGGGERQRSKSRTPSASGSISGSAASGYPMWYNQHQYHPVPPMNQHWMQGQA